ncbi:MAG TPA: complex I subunit 5 family protein [Elusimicrobiales bacterium]|nr:complex I subunit 5 family protein [Elusimicrobiales bacterium]
MTSSPGLLAYLLIPLFTAVLIPFAARFKTRMADVLANVTLLAGLLNLSLLLFDPANADSSFSAIPEDGFSLLMVFVIYLVGLCVTFFSTYFMEEENGAARAPYFALIMTSVSAMCGIVTTGDFFTLYVFIEVLAVSSFALIAAGERTRGLEGAIKYLLLTFPASLFILLGVAFLMLTAGTFSFEGVKTLVASGMPAGGTVFAVSLLLLGFLIKSGVVPFHAWTPDAYEGAYSPVSAFLAGIVTKIAGVYAVIKIAIILRLFDVKTCPAADILMFLGMLSIAVGAVAALRQNELKRMLAFSSISQVGYIVLAAGIGTPLAILGAIFHLVNHATFKTTLYLNSASLEKGAGTSDMTKLGGMEHSMPWTSWTSVVALMSTAGVPPLSGFWSKLLIIVALWDGGARIYAVLALLFSIVTLAYFMVMQRKVFFGKPTEASRAAREVRPAMLAPVVAMSVLIVALGVFFPYIYAYLVDTVAARIIL